MSSKKNKKMVRGMGFILVYTESGPSSFNDMPYVNIRGTNLKKLPVISVYCSTA